MSDNWIKAVGEKVERWMAREASNAQLRDGTPRVTHELRLRENLRFCLDDHLDELERGDARVARFDAKVREMSRGKQYASAVV